MAKNYARNNLENYRLTEYDFLMKNKVRSIYIHGPLGSGKSHVLDSMSAEFRLKVDSNKIKLISIMSFIDEMIESIKNNSISIFLESYTKDVEVLLIDDIEELKNKEGTQEMFLKIYNELLSKNKLMVMTSINSPNELTGFNIKLLDRFQGSLRIPLEYPKKVGRKLILKKLCFFYDLPIREDVINFLASKGPKSIRKLESILIKSKLISLAMDRPINTDLIMIVLDEENL